MNRILKIWAGIVLSACIVLLLLTQRHADNERMLPVWEQKYQRTRMRIGLHLTNLRHEYAGQRIAYAQNTALEIRALWEERDVLFHVLRKQKSRFPSDSLRRLETLIDRRAALTTVLAEIDRIERVNDEI